MRPSDITLPQPPSFPLPPLPAESGAREQVLHAFARHVYGVTPTGEVVATARELSRDAVADGKAVRRQVVLTLERESRSVDLHLLFYTPAGAAGGAPDHTTGPCVPAFLGLNFGGNQTVEHDPAIRISTSHTIAKPGVHAHRATEATRGSAAGRWPVEQIVSRGYALVTLHCGDVRPDNDDPGDAGVQTLFPDAAGVPDEERWGAIGAWAWGLSRVLDLLGTSFGIDRTSVIAIGHSRLGKAALWAGAQDERFAGVISNCSGCGGAAIYRRCAGERITDITRRFPHWFCRAHERYRGAEHELPVDQHMLLSLIAPRMLHVGSATEDLWADPQGELLAAILASETYRRLGREGLPPAWSEGLIAPAAGAIADDADETAALDPVPSVGGALRYHRRAGAHDITAEDWAAYLDHADYRFRMRTNARE
ncbi:MAG: hypothetical protein ACLFPO_08910 [Spirochaetaceae bacterium]